MVVSAIWPGATVEDTLEQITDRLERKLQETPSLDYVKSYTSAGRATIFVNLKDSTRPADVPGIWYQVRKKVRDIAGTLPQGVVGPAFDDEFGDTYGIVYGFTANGFSERELLDWVHDVRKQLLELPDISKIDILGAQDERVYVEFSPEKLAGLGIDRARLIDALAEPERRHAGRRRADGRREDPGPRLRCVPIASTTSWTSTSSPAAA